jgi:peptidoglycan biosynthesis protein MviN/MurJ (putative lipid II flippase)
MTGVDVSKDADRSVSASKAGLITTGLTLVNVILGFAFQSIVAARLGLSQTSDEFQLAWSIVTFGTVIFFTLVPILLVPRLEDPITRAISLGDLPKFVALGLVLAAAQVGYAATCAPDLGEILRWSAASHVFAALTAIPQATAYVRKRFIAAGIGPAVNGAALLGSFLWLGQGHNPAGLGAALSLGYCFQFLIVCLFSMRRGGPYAPTSQVPITLFLFLLAFTLLSKFQPLLERILSLTGPTGATATLGFGQKIAQGLLLFAAFGLALTANATLARRVKAGQLDTAAELLAKTVVSTMLFSTVVVLVMLPLQRVVIDVLFVRGEFGVADAQAVSDVLLCQIPWVLACALTGSLTSYLYIERNYVRVAAAALIGLAVTYIASVLLQPFMPTIAVPIASSAGASVTLVWVTFLVARSPIWTRLKSEVMLYRSLLAISCFALVISLVLAAVARLTAIFDETVTSVLMALVFFALIVVVRSSSSLWNQSRAVIGGRL